MNVIDPRSHLMRAVVVGGVGTMPTVERRAVRSPSPGEALIAVEACGVCGSDRLLLDGGFGDVFPVVPGHEAAGRVVAVGDSKDSAWIGRRVALYYLDAPNGGALAGRPNLGPGIMRMGVDTDGALADYVVRPLRTLIPADDLTAIEAAVLTDAVSTPHHALGLAEVGPGDAVAVIGIGGIGSNAVQLAATRGARVLAIGRRAETSALAFAMGAAEYRTSDVPVDELRTALGRPLDAVLQCSESRDADRLAIEIAGIGGRVVMVGANVQPFSVTSAELIWKGLSVMGSRGFTPTDIRSVMDLYRGGHIRIDHLTSTTAGIEEAPAVLSGDLLADALRVIITMDEQEGAGQ